MILKYLQKLDTNNIEKIYSNNIDRNLLAVKKGILSIYRK